MVALLFKTSKYMIFNFQTKSTQRKYLYIDASPELHKRIERIQKREKATKIAVVRALLSAALEEYEKESFDS